MKKIVLFSTVIALFGAAMFARAEDDDADMGMGMGSPSAQMEFKFGARLAYNYSNGVMFQKFEGSNLGGSGVEAGALALIKPHEDVGLQAGLSLVYRNPVTYKEYNVKELAASVPLTVQYSPPVFKMFAAELGVQTDIKLHAWQNNNGVKGKFDGRVPVDVGIILGAAALVTENISIGLRYFYALTEYEDRGDYNTNLYQANLGVTYYFD